MSVKEEMPGGISSFSSTFIIVLSFYNLYFPLFCFHHSFLKMSSLSFFHLAYILQESRLSVIIVDIPAVHIFFWENVDKNSVDIF